MITFTLNGENVSSRAEPMDRLLDVLRGEFGLHGPKEGCGEGECGACACLIDGELHNSCITPAGAVQGHSVVTLDGFRKTPQYRLLEETFAEAGAVQCGFCTPGMTMAAQAILSKNPHPDKDTIREAISGNLCRCTGYNMIIDAISLAAERGHGLW
jgi:carbon-monoxide dehydrogenase small subunit